MFVKFCGFKEANKAEYAAHLGVDAIGLVFYQKSKRCVPLSLAAEIVRKVCQKTMVVGVFVDEDESQILRIARKVGLNAVQLHGSEMPEDYGNLIKSGLKIIKAVKPEVKGSFEMAKRWAAYSFALLLDSHLKGVPGGTGKSFSLSYLEPYLEEFPRVIVAGGINKDNLKNYLHLKRLYGIDISSGIEDAFGKKSIKKMEEIIREVRKVEKSLHL